MPLPPAPASLPEEFGKPIPIRRLDSYIWVGHAKVLVVCLILAAVGWGGLELYQLGFVTLLVVSALLAALLALIGLDYLETFRHRGGRR